MVCDKNWPFFILYEKYRMSSCTTCLIRNSNTPMSLVMDLIDLLGSKFGSYFLIRMISVRFLSCCTFMIMVGLVQVFLNLLPCPQIDTLTLWNLPAWIPNSAACHFQISRRVNLIMVLLSSQTVPTDSNLLHSWQNLKQTKHMLKINNLKWQQFTHCTM